jgi:hypothetical protein
VPSNLSALEKGASKVLSEIPDFVNPHHFFVKITFPTQTCSQKLIYMHGRAPLTVRDIIIEFLVFLVEIYNLEQLTLEEEKLVVECASCWDEDFDRFQRGTEPQKCLICSEESDSALTLDCGHSFGEDCIQRWFREHNTCPLCRQPIKPCPCGGNRETLHTYVPPLDSYIQNEAISTGALRIEPYEIDDLLFTSIVYDRMENTFTLRHLQLYIDTEESAGASG